MIRKDSLDAKCHGIYRSNRHPTNVFVVEFNIEKIQGEGRRYPNVNDVRNLYFLKGDFVVPVESKGYRNAVLADLFSEVAESEKVSYYRGRTHASL